jgi:hypothetical protein
MENQANSCCAQKYFDEKIVFNSIHAFFKGTCSENDGSFLYWSLRGRIPQCMSKTLRNLAVNRSLCLI